MSPPASAQPRRGGHDRPEGSPDDPHQESSRDRHRALDSEPPTPQQLRAQTVGVAQDRGHTQIFPAHAVAPDVRSVPWPDPGRAASKALRNLGFSGARLRRTALGSLVSKTTRCRPIARNRYPLGLCCAACSSASLLPAPSCWPAQPALRRPRSRCTAPTALPRGARAVRAVRQTRSRPSASRLESCSKWDGVGAPGFPENSPGRDRDPRAHRGVRKRPRQ